MLNGNTEYDGGEDELFNKYELQKLVGHLKTIFAFYLILYTEISSLLIKYLITQMK